MAVEFYGEKQKQTAPQAYGAPAKAEGPHQTPEKSAQSRHGCLLK